MQDDEKDRIRLFDDSDVNEMNRVVPSPAIIRLFVSMSNDPSPPPLHVTEDSAPPDNFEAIRFEFPTTSPSHLHHC